MLKATDQISVPLRLDAFGREATKALQTIAHELGVDPDPENTTLVALAVVVAGFPEETVSRRLSWRDFERFCSGLIRASGFSVRENLFLKKPRAQIDLVATGTSAVLSIDCKHWSRGHSRSAMGKFAKDQLRRSELLRKQDNKLNPIVSVILCLSQPAGEFVDGVAFVPVRALRVFLRTFESHYDFLETR